MWLEKTLSWLQAQSRPVALREMCKALDCEGEVLQRYLSYWQQRGKVERVQKHCQLGCSGCLLACETYYRALPEDSLSFPRTRES